jgi:ATP-dependent Clp endopeptidase proteolytic subunit ClpP
MLIKPWTIKNIDANTTEIMLYGFIGEGQAIDDAAFVLAFKDCEKNFTNINVRVNCGGGDVFKGIAIFNCIKNSTANTAAYIDGVAASMGGIIPLACKKIFMSSNARFMIHRAKGGAEGDVDDIKNYANLMLSLENDLADIISKRCGMTTDEVKAKWMQRGTNTWFTAKEAKAAKLIDDTYDGPAIEAPMNSITDQEELFKFYNKTNENQSMKNLPKFIALFALANMTLPSDATEETILNSMQVLVDKNKELLNQFNSQKTELDGLKAKVQAADDAKITNLIDSAEQAKKITAEQKPTYLKLAKADYDSTKAILDKMPSYKSIKDQLVNEPVDAEKAKRTFSDWQKKDPKGLAEMKVNDKSGFIALFKAEYGKEPKMD